MKPEKLDKAFSLVDDDLLLEAESYHTPARILTKPRIAIISLIAVLLLFIALWPKTESGDVNEVIHTHNDPAISVAEGMNNPKPKESEVPEKDPEIIPFVTETAPDGTVYTIVDHLAADQPYSILAGGEIPVFYNRMEKPFSFVSCTDEEGFTYFTLHNDVNDDDVTFGILHRLPDLEPDIRAFTGMYYDDKEFFQISISIKFSSALPIPMTKANSRYGIFWMNQNFAFIGGVSFRQYMIVRNYEEGLLKGMQVLDTQGDYTLLAAGPMAGSVSSIMSSGEVKDSEKEELQRLLDLGDLVVLKH